MGSPWKMFTQAQGQELINGTNSTWTSINGVNGRKFTSKTDSTKYIFLTAAGNWDGSSHDGTGSYGLYWGTTWYSSSEVCYMYIYNVNSYIYNNYRRYGKTVRAIQ